MNFLPTFPALILCCFVYFRLATCKPLDSISEEEIDQGLRQLDEGSYKGFLMYAIPATSSGKNLFKIPQTVKEDCIRTTRAITQEFYKLSTSMPAINIIGQSVKDSVKYRSSTSFYNEVNMVCANINEKVKRLRFTFQNFDELKKTAEIPKPAKNYIVEIPVGRNFIEYVNNTAVAFDDPEMFKFQVMVLVQNFRNMILETEEDRPEFVVIAIALDLMVSRTNHIDTMDKLFKDTFDDYIKQLLTAEGNISQPSDFDSHAIKLLNKVDQNFLKNELLKDLYSRMKREAKKFSV